MRRLAYHGLRIEREISSLRAQLLQQKAQNSIKKTERRFSLFHIFVPATLPMNLRFPQPHSISHLTHNNRPLAAVRRWEQEFPTIQLERQSSQEGTYRSRTCGAIASNPQTFLPGFWFFRPYPNESPMRSESLTTESHRYRSSKCVTKTREDNLRRLSASFGCGPLDSRSAERTVRGTVCFLLSVLHQSLLGVDGLSLALEKRRLGCR